MVLSLCVGRGSSPATEVYFVLRKRRAWVDLQKLGHHKSYLSFKCSVGRFHFILCDLSRKLLRDGVWLFMEVVPRWCRDRVFPYRKCSNKVPRQSTLRAIVGTCPSSESKVPCAQHESQCPTPSYARVGRVPARRTHVRDKRRNVQDD